MEGSNNIIDLRKIVLGNPSRLRFIIRFSNCPRIHDESVSDHSFYVALYTYYIAMDLYWKGYKSLDVGIALGKALVHDMDECFSGDFIRMFKHSNPELKKEVDEACKRFMLKFSSEITPDIFLQGQFYDYWNQSKKDVEGMIVAFADYLSVLSYIHQEIDLGNHRMERQVPELISFYKSFKDEKFKILNEYIETAGEILEEIQSSIKERKNVSGKI